MGKVIDINDKLKEKATRDILKDMETVESPPSQLEDYMSVTVVYDFGEDCVQSIVYPYDGLIDFQIYNKATDSVRYHELFNHRDLELIIRTMLQAKKDQE